MMKPCTQPAYADKASATKAANFMLAMRNRKLYPHACAACQLWHLHDRKAIQ